MSLSLAHAQAPMTSGLKADKSWDLSVGVGALAKPEYMGSEDTEVQPVPLIDFTYDDWFFASTQKGVGVQTKLTPYVTVGTRFNYDMGRDESINAKLSGMGDIDGTVTGGVFAKFSAGYWQFSAGIDQDITGSGHGGYLATLDASWGTSFDNGATLTTTIGATYMDDSYAGAYFSVDAIQSGATGYNETDAGFGLRDIHGSITGTYPFTEHVSGVAQVTFVNLNGDAQSSPIAEQDSYVSGLVGFSYDF